MGAIAGRNFSVQENLKKFTKMKHLLISLVLVCVYLNTATGHCCGHCVPALCSCFQKEGGCDVLSESGDCQPEPNSHLCCAPKSAGDCNLFCCECSSCCDRADGGSNVIPALEKWQSIDKNKDMHGTAAPSCHDTDVQILLVELNVCSSLHDHIHHGHSVHDEHQQLGILLQQCESCDRLVHALPHNV